MTIFYVDPASGNDTNGGSSVGSAIASGTAGSTNGTATVDLSGDTPDLSGVSVGDTIRLSAETGGQGAGTSDIFEITAVDDTLDTVTVTPTPGTNSGQTWAIGGAWASLQKAADEAIAGDEVRLMNTATEQPTAKIDFDTNVGERSNPIRFVGADASGDPLDGAGHYTISGASMASGNLIEFNSAVYLEFIDVRVTASKSIGIHDASFSSYNSFLRCRIDNNVSHGMTIQGEYYIFTDTEIDSNGGAGMKETTANRGGFILVHSKVHGNGSDGISLGRISDTVMSVALSSLIYNNGGHGFNMNAGLLVDSCTIYGNTGSGISLLQSDVDLFCTNTSFVSNGEHAIDFTSERQVSGSSNNHGHNNTSGDLPTGLYGGSFPGIGNQSGNPLFADAANGDFTPGAGSPLIEASVSGGTIGAVEPATGGGGGGGISQLAGIGGGLITAVR